MVTKIENKRKLKKLVGKLSDIKGRHTELVTVYIPHDYQIKDIVNQLREEKGTAKNIKSKQTRKHVITALDKMVQHLKSYKKTPDNGLALFCGNVSETEGKTNVKIWAVEPPEPIQVRLYWCDQEFELEPLEDMLEEKEVFGMLVMDKSEANIATLKGKKIRHKKHIGSNVPGKTRAGGQSAARFSRIRERMLENFFNQVGESMKNIFGNKEVQGILIGGPGPIKEDFHSGSYLSKSLKEEVMDIKNTGYTGEQGLEELLNRSEDALKEAKITKEKKLMKKFFDELRSSGKVTYGIKEILRALKMGAVDTLIISEDLEWEEVEYKCQECDWSGKKFVKIVEKEDRECPECGGYLNIIGERNIFEAMEERAEDIGAETEVVSKDTQEGKQFYQLGGIGAILRYRIS